MKKKIACVIICILVVACGWNVTLRELNRTEETDSEYKEMSANAGAQSSIGQLISLEDNSQETETFAQYDEQSSTQEKKNTTDSSVEKAEADNSIESDASDIADSVTDSVAETTDVTEPADVTESVPQISEDELVEESAKYETGYIFVGDSRFYLMNQLCRIEDVPNFFVVSCPGMGYEWLVNTAFPKVQSLQRRHDEIENWVVICGLGINDLTSVNSYLNKYRRWPQNSKLYLLSVNPTSSGAPANCSNKRITAFNKRLKTVKNATYLDCYHYLKKVSYGTSPDGIHYADYTNWAIYEYILEQLNKKAGGEPVASDIDCQTKVEKLEDQLSERKY